MRIALTGHRPKRLKGQEDKIRKWIDEQLEKYNTPENGRVYAFSGMAQGADQIFAKSAINHGCFTICCFPYRKKNFHPEVKAIMNKANSNRFISEKYTGNKVYWLRDKYLVDNCDVLLAVWDGKKKGGTWITVKYAQEIGKSIIFYDFKEEKNG